MATSIVPAACLLQLVVLVLLQVDMEGKRADWEGVVLVPFVDEVRGNSGSSRAVAAVLPQEVPCA